MSSNVETSPQSTELVSLTQENKHSIINVDKNIKNTIKEATISIAGMTCLSCSSAIEKVLSTEKMAANGIIKAQVSLVMNTCMVTFDSALITIEDIIEEIEEIGYDAHLSRMHTLHTSNNSKKNKPNSHSLTIANLTRDTDIIEWKCNLTQSEIQFNRSEFSEILNDMPGILNVSYTDNCMIIEFNKIIILPLAITHLLQNEFETRLVFENISVQQKHPLPEEYKDKDVPLKSIVFTITTEDSAEEKVLTESEILDSLQNRFSADIISSVMFNKKLGHLTVEYYPKNITDNETVRAIYNYVQHGIEFGDSTIITVLDSLSYERDEFRDNQQKQMNKMQNKFIIACIFTIPCFIIAMILPLWSNVKHLLMTEINTGDENGKSSITVNGLILFSLSTPVQFYVASMFYVSAWKALKRKTSNMSTLIVLGTSVAWIYSFIALMIGFIDSDNKYMKGSDHFFETSATVITIVIAGKWLQMRAKFKACDAISMLMDLQAPKAILVSMDECGNFVHQQRIDEELKEETDDDYEISTELIGINDIIKVYRGQRIAMDGDVVYGSTSIDESTITGESMPRTVRIGDKVIASSINCGDNCIYIIVRKSKQENVICKLIELMKTSQLSKPSQQEIADVISSYFVPVCVAIAVATFIIWYVLAATNNLEEKYIGENENELFFAILFAMAVLVIACPCALGLAVPTAIMVGMGIASKYGCLIKGGHILEIAYKLNIIVFDKTGTLTLGKPTVNEFVIVGDGCSLSDLLFYAGSAERNSEHPLAKAIVKYCKQHLRKDELLKDRRLVEPSAFQVLPGKGIRATIDGKSVCVGNYAWISRVVMESDVNNGNTCTDIEDELLAKNSLGHITLLMAIDNELQAYLTLYDPPRPESKQLISELKAKHNIRCIMLTGDHENTAIAIANYVGIERSDIFSQVLPEDKHSKIAELQKQINTQSAKENIVAMVGDGINDSAALSQSNLGIAIGDGTDIAIESADVILTNTNLFNILMLLDLSTTIIHRIYWNFFWAFGFNILGIPIAAGLFYPWFLVRLRPEFASIAMGGSSLCVLLSSLMLKRYRYISPFKEKVHGGDKHKVYNIVGDENAVADVLGGDENI